MALRRAEAQAAPVARRGFGVIRVSKVGKRSEERLISPHEQRRRIVDEAAREHIEVLDCFEEIDVSGRKPLHKRTGLKQAVERVERGEGNVIIGAYFDRLVRNSVVKREVVDRVEQVGGQVLALDFGPISHKTASQWLSSEVVSLMSEHYAIVIKEKTMAARLDALDRGIVVFRHIPLGYRKVDRRLQIDETTGPLVAECFRLRARGATIQQIRSFLRERGVERSYRQVQIMFELELYLGQMRDGDQISDNTHSPLVDLALFRQAQQVKITRGRNPREPRLLSKLGLLVCGNCRGAMFTAYKLVAGKPWAMYRCQAHAECPNAVTISARQLEAVVVEYVRAELERIRPGMASVDEQVAFAEADYEACQRDLDDTVANLKGITSANVRQVLLEKQAALEQAAERLQRVRAAAGPLELLRGDRDWDELEFDEQRAVLRRAFTRIVVLGAVIDGVRLPTRDRVKPEPA